MSTKLKASLQLLWMCKTMTLFKWVWVIVDLKYDYICLKKLKERSLEEFVAGMTRINVANVHTSGISALCDSDSSLRYSRTEVRLCVVDNVGILADITFSCINSSPSLKSVKSMISFSSSSSSSLLAAFKRRSSRLAYSLYPG